MASSRQRVVVGMSGGVDSSVAAATLVEDGYDVVGLFMKNWEDDDEEHCAAAADLADAAQVCANLGIRLETINFSHEYWENVFRRTLEELRRGRTPNPDVLCNREIKFKEFLERAAELGAGLIATGHYVRAGRRAGKVALLKGIDADKDQSYFLHGVESRALARSLFPLGGHTKREVRALARRVGLHNHQKKDSTGLCFIGERKFRTFIERYLPRNPGTVRTVDGDPVARHDGLMYYTIGQRHGLGIGGAGEPWYVAGKNVSTNELTVVQGHDHPALMSRTVRVGGLHWIGPPPVGGAGNKFSAKTRYRQTDQSCVLTLTGDGNASVVFECPQRAVTPGQSLVLYAGEVCLGGGVIESTDATERLSDIPRTVSRGGAAVA